MMDRNRALLATVLVGCLLPVGCAPYLGPAEARDVDLSMPERFGESGVEDNAAHLPVERFFQDPKLIALVDEALANNQELNVLQQEIAIANSEIMARQGEYQPKVSYGAGAGIEKVGEFTSQGASDRADAIEPGRRVPENLQDYGLGFFATWEVDIWSKLRNATKAALFRFMASIEGRNFAVTRMVAEIAHAYYELMALDNQLATLQANIEILTTALDVVRVQKVAARVTELAVQRFEAEVLRNRARVFDVQQRIAATENRLNVLVGRFPQPVERSSDTFLQLEPTAVATGLPAQMLANRPDLKQAELSLAAAKLDVSVAKLQFYPSLSIETAAGLDAYRPASLTVLPESIFYNALANVTGPLLNRKSLTAAYQVANARQMQAVLSFERAMRAAYAEAATQIAMIRNLGGKYELKAQQVEILRSAIDVSSQLFASARADYMEVLLTRRDALESQMELIETRQLQLGAMVNMYQALGGGWRHEVRADHAGDGGADG